LFEAVQGTVFDNGKHENLMPQALHNTQKEYKDYPLTVFRKHIYQEVCCKFIAQHKSMAEKKKNKSKKQRK
jgi:hypothetical protein